MSARAPARSERLGRARVAAARCAAAAARVRSASAVSASAALTTAAAIKSTLPAKSPAVARAAAPPTPLLTPASEGGGEGERVEGAEADASAVNAGVARALGGPSGVALCEPLGDGAALDESLLDGG